MGTGKSMKDAPPILADSLIFPYIRGLIMCAKLVNDGGWAAIDEAYKNPPLSTEQVIHPEKYLLKPDIPTDVDLGTLNPGKDWKEVTRNVVGEMQTAVLLKAHSGKEAAAGWDGDQFVTFEGPDGKLGLVWASTWDSENDAREFARSYLQFQTKKLGKAAKMPEAYPDSTRRPSQGMSFAVERRGADVSIIEGFSADTTERLIETAFQAKKSEKGKIPSR